MSEKEIVRLQRWRLGVIRHVLEVSHNVAKTCRYYGIGRTAYYEWYKRYQEEGEEGLMDKSKRPLHSPLSTSSEVVAKIFILDKIIILEPSGYRCISKDTMILLFLSQEFREY